MPRKTPAKKKTSTKAPRKNTINSAVESALIRIYKMEALEEDLRDLTDRLFMFCSIYDDDKRKELSDAAQVLYRLTFEHKNRAFQDALMWGLAGSPKQQEALRELARREFLRDEKDSRTRNSVMHFLDPHGVHQSGYLVSDDEEFRAAIREKFAIEEEEND